MNSSKYPDGILIDHVALRRTELTKAAEILRGRTDWTSRGMFSGGAITVNALDLTKIDVALLSGFVPNGEYIETSSDYYSIALQDYTLNTVNVIVAVYCENETYKQPHESNGTVIATCAEMAWRIRAYSEANFALLPATDPNLGNDAIDRCLIIGKVSANGVGVALTTSDIFSPTSYDALLYSVPMTFTTIPGVTVLAISSDTIPGAGTLEHYALAGPVHYLRYNAPNMAVWPVCPPNVPPGFGWVEITTDGNYSLAGSAGTFMTVQVILSMLPSVIATTTSVALDVYNLYYQEIPRLSAEDNLHRSLIGTGVITPTNPHGTSLTDISGSDLGLLAEHQDLLHSGGFVYTSSASAAQATISFPLTADMLSLVPLVGQDAYYCNGKRVTTFAPTSFMFEPAVIPTATTGTHLYEVYLSDEGVAAVHHKAMIDESGGPRTITGVWPVDMSVSYPASAGLALNLTVGADYTFSFNGGEAVVVLAAADSQVIRLYDYTSEGWLDLLVNTNDIALSPDANLPGVGVYLDNLIVYASPDWTQNIQVASVLGWLDALAAPPRFAIGYKPYQGGARSVVDKRARGTLAVENISDSALQTLVYSPEDELHESGVLYKRNTTFYDFAYYGAAGLTINFRGGGYYCRGKRIDYAGSAQTLYDNEINLIYLDAGGTMRIIPVTADFAGVIADAVDYVIGSTHLTPWVSSVYEATDPTDSPERGVVLYSIVTAGGAITGYTNLMRNVNGPVTPFSVSSFSLTSYLGLPLNNLSAFDSLYAAFLYANLRSSRDYQIDVILNGVSYVDSTIVQPTNVNVYGKLSALPNVLINTVDANGAWQLSSGCKVSEVKIQPILASAVSIKLNNNVTVEKCVYACSAGVSDIFLNAGATTYYNVHIKENKVSTQSSMVTATSTSNYDWWIEDNTVSQFANGIASSLINVSGKNIFITHNKLATHNSVTSTPAISGTLAGEYLVDGNVIELGTSADAAFDYGISLDANTSYIPQILNNSIKRAAGSASHVGIGIYVVDGGAIVRGNSLTGMGGGIYVKTNDLPYTQIEGNAVGAGYHFGIQISTNAGSWSVADDVTIRGNTITGLVKNSGGSGGGLFDDDLYGIWVRGGIVSGISAGNMIISDNTITNLANAIDNVSGIYASYSFALGGTSSFDGISINGNTIKSLAALPTGGTTYGIYLSFYAAAPGVVSTLACRGLSVSNNSVRGVLSTDEDAYGIYGRFNIDAGHTTGLSGLTVNGNTVAGFWGDVTDSTSISAGIQIEGVSVLDEVWGVTCNSNTVGTNSGLIVGGVDNDDTNIYCIYGKLSNMVVNGNNLTITGAATTVRGDGIRMYLNGGVSDYTRSVISGNSIDVNWTGIHTEGVTSYGMFDVSDNRINSRSVGVYIGPRVAYSSVSKNTIIVNSSNACSYTGCTLDGTACIVGNDGDPISTIISGNNVSLIEYLNAQSANIWLKGSTNCAVDGNITYQDRLNPVNPLVNEVSHIKVFDSGGGITSVSGNTVNNTANAGANGILLYQTTNSSVMLNALNNKVLGINIGGGPPWEILVNIDALLPNPTAFAYGNIVQTASAGAPNITPHDGAVPNTALSLLYDNHTTAWDIPGNVRTWGAGGATGQEGW